MISPGAREAQLTAGDRLNGTNTAEQVVPLGKPRGRWKLYIVGAGLLLAVWGVWHMFHGGIAGTIAETTRPQPGQMQRAPATQPVMRIEPTVSVGWYFEGQAGVQLDGVYYEVSPGLVVGDYVIGACGMRGLSISWRTAPARWYPINAADNAAGLAAGGRPGPSASAGYPGFTPAAGPTTQLAR